MELPKELKIGAHRYSVEVVKDPVSCDGWSGAFNKKYLAIRLDSDNKPSVQGEVLIHEILHGVWQNQGLDEHHELKGYEEYLVDILAKGLYQVLKENKLHFDVE